MKFIRTLVILYLVILGGLWAFRISLLYPFDPTQVAPSAVGLNQVATHELLGKDGTKLVVWAAPARAGKPIIVYFHGNAGNLANRAKRFDILTRRGYGLVAMAYRGSSGSEGVPSEVSITEDTQILMENLSRFIGDTKGNKLIYYGESLGTGVAVKTALSHPADALILEAPYKSIVGLAAQQMPIFPIRSILDERWETIAHISILNIPTFVLHGAQDKVIPVTHGKSVFAASPSMNKTLKILQDRNHHNLWSVEGQTAMYHFINGL